MNGIDNIVYSGSVEIEDSSILPSETKSKYLWTLIWSLVHLIKEAKQTQYFKA